MFSKVFCLLNNEMGLNGWKFPFHSLNMYKGNNQKILYFGPYFNVTTIKIEFLAFDSAEIM